MEKESYLSLLHCFSLQYVSVITVDLHWFHCRLITVSPSLRKGTMCRRILQQKNARNISSITSTNWVLGRSIQLWSQTVMQLIIFARSFGVPSGKLLLNSQSMLLICVFVCSVNLWVSQFTLKITVLMGHLIITLQQMRPNQMAMSAHSICIPSLDTLAFYVFYCV